MRKLLSTIRVRLTIWNSLVVLLATFLALFAARQGMRYALEQETRELLQEELTELELAVSQLYPDENRIVDEFERKVLSHGRHDWFARLMDRKLKTVWQSQNYPHEFVRNLDTNAKPFSFFQTEDLILASHAIEIPDGERFRIVLGEPTTFIKRDVWNLTKIMLLVGGALLIVAPIGGYFLARNAMQPVREIIQTTKQLDPTNLNSRLALRGTGDELDQISGEINSFVELISHYLSGQREFIANAAHDLRSPLTAIQTSVEVCLTKARSADEYCEQLETVSEQCQFLRHLVNQLLELAELDAAVLIDKIEFDLTELVNKSVSFFSGIADEKDIQLIARLHPKTSFQGDPAKMMQVVNNLIDNALKFTTAGGLVEIELTKTSQELNLLVKDNGAGVPADSLEKIFERFYQVDPARNRDAPHGNGLGLSICKSIVEQHGGTISAISNRPTGLCVTASFKNRSNILI